MGGAKASCANPYKSIYEISVRAMGGTQVLMSQYSGKLLLIVNVASEWGLTKQNYEELVQLDNIYQSQGLTILGFPCNQFMRQEPGTDEQIAEFAKGFGVKFQIFSKINVNGNDACDLYKFLRLNSSLDGGEIGWNFGKFLVGRSGEIINYYGPRTSPLQFEGDIKKHL